MVKGKSYIAYLRVSTKRQGRSGLGLEAQQQAVADFLKRDGGRLLQPPFVEQESGKDNHRPELAKALEKAKRLRATLIIAKLDRLSRNAAFLLNLRDSGVDFIAVDLPDMNTMTLGIMAVMAQFEREQISQRTIAALAAAKRRGVKLGAPRGEDRFGNAARKRGIRNAGIALSTKADEAAEAFRDIFIELAEKHGNNASAIARELNDMGEVTPRGKQWSPMQVIRTRQRLAA